MIKLKIAFSFLCVAACLCACDAPEQNDQQINRQDLAQRNNVRINAPDSLSPLSVGNGEFAFTVDVSGLQSFPGYYERGVSLGTQSHWGWHTIPTDQDYQLEEVAIIQESCDGKGIPFPVQHRDGRKGDATHWLRSNPHRLHLGMVGLILLKENGEPAEISDLQQIDQELDLWTGKIETRYQIEGQPVSVELYAHQEQDQIAARIQSPLVEQGRLKVSLRFPYGADCHFCPGYDFGKPERHQTEIAHSGDNSARLNRTLDSAAYFVDLSWKNAAALSETRPHHFELTPAQDGDTFEFGVLFSQNEDGNVSDFAATETNSLSNWEKYWTEGAAIDFSACTDPRAPELERRVVLSQYLTKIQCAGSLPPQETGLTMNSWYGKFHLEMHWWHGVHFALWDRIDLLEKSLWWYEEVKDKARKTAEWQGYDGVRWQKMTDPSGNESPSSVGVYLIWQQPHIIYFAELIYRQDSSRQTLEKYQDLIFETADFMASLPVYDENDQKYRLCRPLIPAQEPFPPSETDDPPFELAYWHYGLSVAQEWRKRLGLPENERWKEVAENLAPLPIADSLYLPAATAPMAYKNFTYRRDHPMVLGSYGILPLSEKIDTTIMGATFDEIMTGWQWETTWGWDYPMMAMSAARLNKPEKAIDALFMDLQKNTYLPNGHNYQDERLTIYLPGNGGLLTAVAMMAAGWDGAPERENPGFPDNGQWNVKWEGLHKMP